MEFLGDVFSNILSGGATGLVGTIATAWVSLKKAKENNRHAEKMTEQEHQNIRAEAEANLKMAETEGEIAQAIENTKAAGEALKQSYQHDQRKYSDGPLTDGQRWLMVIVDFARGMMRPTMTGYLVVLTTVMFFVMLNQLEGLSQAISADSMVTIVQHIILTVLYLTATCVTWWFGGRQLEKFGVLQKV